MYEALTGREPLSAPVEYGSDGYENDLRAYEAQNRFFDTVIDAFIEDDYNLKTVIKEVVRSPYFRAYNLDQRGVERVDELDAVGVGRLLTPEQLDRKIEAVLGFPWRARPDSTDYLLGDYRIFYGGIDSTDVTERIEQPNGIIANIGLRMATEMACVSVARDFTFEPAERLLFPLVEPTFQPEDVNGFEVQQAVDAIRRNIQYLFEHVLGETVSLNDPELDRAYELFYETWQEGVEGLADGSYDTWLPWQCQARDEYWSGEELPDEERITNDPDYTIRAWMAVITYLLSDYRFLYQ